MFSLGGSEILVLAVIALLLFGNKNLPENMKKIVKGLNEVKRVTNDAQRSWNEIRTDITRQIMADEALELAKKELANIKNTLEARQQLPETISVPEETEETAALTAPEAEVVAPVIPENPADTGTTGAKIAEPSDPSKHG